MLPVLEAGESMRHAEEHALGAGMMKQEDSRDVWNRWRRLAEGPGGRESRRAKLTVNQQAMMLAGMGIGVEIVPRKQRPE